MCDALIKDMTDAAKRNKESSNEPVSSVPITGSILVCNELREADSRVF